jgi:hypothetical protein
MAKVISATLRPDGKVLVSYDDNTTAVMTSAEAAKNNIKPTITSSTGNTGSTGGSTGGSNSAYNSSLSGAFDATTATVNMNGKDLTISDAIMQSNNLANLKKIRSAMVAAKQLTKAEASDPQKVLSQWANIIYGAAQDPETKDPFAYLKKLQQAGFVTSTGAAANEISKPYAQGVVWDATKAQSFITEQYRNILHRDPTPDELTKDTKALTKKQTDAKSASKTTYKKINGVLTGVTTGGLDEAQWFTNKLTKTPEYKDVQSRLNNTAVQSLKSVAAANGVDLTPGQLDDWSKRLAAGENIDTFKAILRDQAALGQPESVRKLLGQGVDLTSVYQPYKNQMAAILELNPDSISLNDPTLRSAIGPDKEMTLYDFQKALRKDPRWQYTNNAKENVSSSVQQVLKDFGFMG